MRHYLPAFSILLAAGLTLASGVIHGRMSNRWGPQEDLLALGKKLEEFTRDKSAKEFGDWRLDSSEKMGDEAVNILQCVGHFIHTYKDLTGDSVTVTVLVGPAGPLSVHPPEVCYGGAGYRPMKARERVTVRDSEGLKQQFWKVPLQPGDVTQSPLQVYYAWNTGDRWSAPEQARFAYGGCPYLYKIQVATQLTPQSGLDSGDPCPEFLEHFVPRISQYLDKPPGR